MLPLLPLAISLVPELIRFRDEPGDHVVDRGRRRRHLWTSQLPNVMTSWPLLPIASATPVCCSFWPLLGYPGTHVAARSNRRDWGL